MFGELQRSTKSDAMGLRPLPSFIRPGFNQVPLERRQPASRFVRLTEVMHSQAHRLLAYAITTVALALLAWALLEF